MIFINSKYHPKWGYNGTIKIVNCLPYNNQLQPLAKYKR
jgi:hypothetical protein